MKITLHKILKNKDINSFNKQKYKLIVFILFLSVK